MLAFRRTAPAVSELLDRWRAIAHSVACGLHAARDGTPGAASGTRGTRGTRGTAVRLPEGVPSSLDEEQAWFLATNDQFGLARLVTPAGASVANLSHATLSELFNWRSRKPPNGPGSIVVRHDGARKDEALRELVRARRKAGRSTLGSSFAAQMRSEREARAFWAPLTCPRFAS